MNSSLPQIMTFALAFLSIPWTPMALAREITVTVHVLDPAGQPIEGASAMIATGPSTLSDSAPTNALGEATITVSIPDLLPLGMLRALILDGPPEATPDEEYLDALETLNDSRMFSLDGTPIQVVLGQDSVSVAVQASPVEIREGTVQGPAAANANAFRILDAESIAIGFVINGSFRSLVPTNRAFLAGLSSDFGTSYHIVPQLQPDGSVPPLTHSIPDATGGLAGTVVNNGPPPGRPYSLAAIRENGAYGLALGVDQNGRIVFNREAAPDPSSNDEQNDVPPGEYVVLLVSNQSFVPYAERLAYLRGVHGNTAVAERAALARITIQPGQRTVATLDLDTLRSTTEALITAVYFTP
jgi:hypothetical protein